MLINKVIDLSQEIFNISINIKSIKIFKIKYIHKNYNKIKGTLLKTNIKLNNQNKMMVLYIKMGNLNKRKRKLVKQEII